LDDCPYPVKLNICFVINYKLDEVIYVMKIPFSMKKKETKLVRLIRGY